MKLLDYSEAAEYLRCSPATLRKKVMVRAVPFVKPFGKNGRVFFIAEDLEKLVLTSGNRQDMLEGKTSRDHVLAETEG